MPMPNKQIYIYIYNFFCSNRKYQNYALLAQIINKYVRNNARAFVIAILYRNSYARKYNWKLFLITNAIICKWKISYNAPLSIAASLRSTANPARFCAFWRSYPWCKPGMYCIDCEWIFCIFPSSLMKCHPKNTMYCMGPENLLHPSSLFGYWP